MFLNIQRENILDELLWKVLCHCMPCAKVAYFPCYISTWHGISKLASQSPRVLLYRVRRSHTPPRHAAIDATVDAIETNTQTPSEDLSLGIHVQEALYARSASIVSNDQHPESSEKKRG